MKTRHDKWQFWSNQIAYPPNVIGNLPIKNIIVLNKQDKQSLFCHITFFNPLKITFTFIDNNETKSYNNNVLAMMKENKRFALLIMRIIGI